MPKLIFTPTELRNYFDGKKMSPVVQSAREYENAIRVHADGVFPEKLISDARPHESNEVLEYRKKIWKPKTKPTFTKIFNSLSKIRRSTDWSLIWPNETFARIPEDETLKKYIEEKFPYFDSLTNWVFSVLLREYLIDPNAVVVVKPIQYEIEETAFLQPLPSVINSSLVIDFVEKDYLIFKNELGATYVENGNTLAGKSFYVVTTMEILRYDQIDSKENYGLAFQYQHGMNELPAYKIGAVLIDSIENNFLYESRICGAIPSLDEAAREYSDLQAAVIMHIYPERWEFATVICNECTGIGKINAPDGGGQIVCPNCKGLGQEPNSPFSKLLIKTPEVGQQQATVPPAGYVEKDIEIVKLQDDRVGKHIFDALAAINMEFLQQVPLNISGTAKEVDKDETNNFVHSVAEDLVRCMDWITYITARMRYSTQYPNENDILEMLPQIPVPEHFDIFSTKFIEDELKNAKDNKLNPVLINAMEVGYATKKFNSDHDIQKRLLLILQLDPLANVTEEDKTMRLSNKGITQEDYVLSSNIGALVKRAIEDDENFLNLDFKKQKEKIMSYVQEIITKNDEAQKLVTDFMNQGGLNDGQGHVQNNNGQQQQQVAA